MDNLVKTLELITKTIQAQHQIINDLIEEVEKLKKKVYETKN